MLSWCIWPSGARDWDATLAKLPGRSVTQTHGWGEHKKRSGWNVIRLAAQAGGETPAMAQVLVKRFPPGIALAWAPGGPVGAIDAWGASFQEAAVRAADARQMYFRINPLRAHRDSDSSALQLAGWGRPRHRMLSGQSMVLDLGPTHEVWLRSTEANHRYRMRKSSAAGLRWAHGTSSELKADFAGLCAALHREKGIPIAGSSLGDIEHLCRCLDGAVLILIGYRDTDPVTGCLVLLHEDTALYAIAATVARGREVSASYSMLAELRKILRDRGVGRLDLGGIDSSSVAARGVYHFKRGFGGSPVQYLGEWQWATSWLLGRLADAAIGRRAGIL